MIRIASAILMIVMLALGPAKAAGPAPSRHDCAMAECSQCSCCMKSGGPVENQKPSVPSPGRGALKEGLAPAVVVAKLIAWELQREVFNFNSSPNSLEADEVRLFQKHCVYLL